MSNKPVFRELLRSACNKYQIKCCTCGGLVSEVFHGMHYNMYHRSSILQRLSSTKYSIQCTYLSHAIRALLSSHQLHQSPPISSPSQTYPSSSSLRNLPPPHPHRLRQRRHTKIPKDRTPRPLSNRLNLIMHSNIRNQQRKHLIRKPSSRTASPISKIHTPTPAIPSLPKGKKKRK